jgi:hypothetical protein
MDKSLYYPSKRWKYIDQKIIRAKQPTNVPTNISNKLYKLTVIDNVNTFSDVYRLP